MDTAKQKKVDSADLRAKLLNTLASVKFAVTVVVLIAVACLIGTLLPQGTEVVAYVRKNPSAAERMQFFDKLGLTHVFYSWWFIALLGVLASTVATCSMRRFATVRRTTGSVQRRALGSMITHISILLILVGGVIRGMWGEKGYIELREGQTQAQFQIDKRSKPLPFALQLADFKIETYAEGKRADQDRGDQILVEWPERKLRAQLPVQLDIQQSFADSFRIRVLKYIPDFIVDMKTREVSSRSNEPNNPAILVEVVGPNYQNNRWLFARFPDFVMHTADGHESGPSPIRMVYENSGAPKTQAAVTGPIKSFKSTLRIVENNQVVQTRVVEVNSPFRYKGYTFYQSGYNPRDLSWTSLQVVRDPGVPVVYAGFCLMIAGLFIVFYLNPWIEARRKT